MKGIISKTQKPLKLDTQLKAAFIGNIVKHIKKSNNKN